MVCCGLMRGEEENALESAEDRIDYALGVIMVARPAKSSPWGLKSWSARGVVCGEQYRDRSRAPRALRQCGEEEEYLFPGLELRLHKDEAESYYHNLMADSPQLYVIARIDENDQSMVPFHVSTSFDEANAYLEVDDEVYSVAMPPEVAVWMERFVLKHYVPEPRKKRKRRDWRREGRA